MDELLIARKKGRYPLYPGAKNRRGTSVFIWGNPFYRFKTALLGISYLQRQFTYDKREIPQRRERCSSPEDI